MPRRHATRDSGIDLLWCKLIWSVVVVLKSDNANGLFGFERTCEPAVVPMIVNELNCTVHRQRGAFDGAVVVWRLEPIDPTLSALQYFVNHTGSVRFADQQTVAVSSSMYSRRIMCVLQQLRRVQSDTTKLN